MISFFAINKSVYARCNGITPPIMDAYDATSITDNSANLSGEIFWSQCSDSNITERGFEYGTSDSYGSTKSETGAFTYGAFNLDVSDLECNTIYHFRSFAVDDLGNIGHSLDHEFTTSACPVVEKKKRTVSGSTAAAIASFKAEQEALKQQLETNQNTNDLLNALNGQVLRFGMVSDLVKMLQVYLNNHGFILADSGPGSPGNETKYFGPRTRQALMLFQTANGLVADGILGPKTIEFIK